MVKLPSPGYYIRNSITGAFIAGDNLQPREFMSRKEARDYMKCCNMNPNIYKIGFFSAKGTFYVMGEK